MHPVKIGLRHTRGFDCGKDKRHSKGGPHYLVVETYRKISLKCAFKYSPVGNSLKTRKPLPII